MKMKRLTVRNVGPVKDVDINLNKLNVFIGPQGSGKSTLAKIISFCTWLEKINDATERAVVDGLIARLVSFHRMQGFFNEDSSILYVGENVAFAYNYNEKISLPSRFRSSNVEHLHNKEFVYYSVSKVENPKVVYIPAERNFVSVVPNLKNYAENNDNLQSFVNDWFDAKRHYTVSNSMPVLNLGLNYYYSAESDRDILILNQGQLISLGASASGFQSIVPMSVLVNWMSTGLYKENKPFSPAENQRIRDMLAHLSGSTVELEKQLIERVRGFIQGKVYTHTQFIIEEPEQNLFPKTQVDFLYYLLGAVNHGRNHGLVITTHSPFILYALNNCLLAYLVRDRIDDDIILSLDCLDYAVDPTTVSVWSLRDGYLCDECGEHNRTIQDKRGLIRKNYFNEVMRQVMGDFNKLLEYDD